MNTTLAHTSVARPLACSLMLGAALLLAGCAEDLSPTPVGESIQDGPPPASEAGPGGDQVTFSETGNQTFQAVVDATSDTWIYVNILTQTQVDPADPTNSDDWHLAHRGVEIQLNGGESGTPSTGISNAIYGDKVDAGSLYPFESVTAAPPESQVEFVTDTAPQSGDAAGGENNPLNGAQTTPGYAFVNVPDADTDPNMITGDGDHGWYTQSAVGSAFAPRDNVGYVLRTHECRWFKLRMTSYSDASGNAGFPTYEFVEIDGGDCAAASSTVAPLGRVVFTATADGMQADVDASDEQAWVHIDLTNSQQVVPSDPDNDPTGWDIALKRTDIKVNGGASGAGNVGIHDMLDADWTSISSEPSDAEYHTDEPGDDADVLAFVTYPPAVDGGNAACGNIDSDFGWYYYSGFCDNGNGQHEITPRDVVYVIRGRDGNIWKLRMLDYYSDAGSAGYPTFEYALISGGL